MAEEKKFTLRAIDSATRNYRLLKFECGETKHNLKDSKFKYGYNMKCKFYLEYMSEVHNPNIFRINNYYKYHNH